MFGFCILFAVMTMILITPLRDIRANSSSQVTSIPLPMSLPNELIYKLFINHSMLTLKQNLVESLTNSQAIRFNSIPKSYFPSLNTVPYATEQFDGL